MSNSKIWITHIGKNFSKSLLQKAQNYTDLPYDEAFKIIISEDTETSFYAKKIIQDILPVLEDFDEKDYLLISGITILNLHVFYILMEKFGKVNLLLFKSRKGEYDYLEIKKEDYESWKLDEILSQEN